MIPKMIKRPSWKSPSDQDIRNEWDWEYVRHVQGTNGTYDVFESEDDFLNAVKKSPLVTVSQTLDSRIGNRSHTSSVQDLKNLVSSYQYPRDVDRIIQGMISGASFPAPIVLKSGPKLRVLGGNTRMDCAFILGLDPKVVMVDVDKWR